MKRLPLRHVSIHGHDVRYRRLGPTDQDRTDGGTSTRSTATSAPAESILLIHGLAGSSKAWDAVIPVLAERYDVIAPDLLGHGESAKPMGDYSLGAFASGLRDFLAVLDVPSVTIVGHSFGGGVAMQLAYQHPHLVDRLVLVGSGGLGREVSWLLRLLSLPGFEYVMPFGFPRPVVEAGTKVGRLLSRRGLRSERLGEFWRSYASLAGAPNRHAFVRTMRGVIEPGGQTVDATDRLYLAARVPTLLIWGENDQVIPVAHANAAHDRIENSRLEVMPGVGHFPHVEQPERFCSVLLDFLASSDPGPIGPEPLRDVILGVTD